MFQIGSFMFKKSLAFGAVFILSSCAYSIDSTIQEVTFVTPGAFGVKCDVYAQDFHHQVRPPQTINIGRGYKSLDIKCAAPGNRRKEVTIEAKLSKTSAWNVFNGVIPGALWDGASGALFTYPPYIEIDFTNVPVKRADVPRHNNPDIIPPHAHQLEEIKPSVEPLRSDSPVEPLEKIRREPSSVQAFEGADVRLKEFEDESALEDLLGEVEKLDIQESISEDQAMDDSALVAPLENHGGLGYSDNGGTLPESLLPPPPTDSEPSVEIYALPDDE